MTPKYLELAEKARNLQAEYKKRAAELDPLRWRLIEAQNEATAEWCRALYAAHASRVRRRALSHMPGRQ